MRKFVFSVLLLILSFDRLDSAELIMFEAGGCEWCETWNDEIGVTYHLTDLGKLFPLRRLDIDAPLPDSLDLFKAIVFSPTFVLVDNGIEVGRIVGYLGEYQFWTLFDRLVQSLPQKKIKLDQKG